MNKVWQAKFYKAVGAQIQQAREAKGWTHYKLSRESGQQIHTIKRIEEGKAFQFHHVTWLTGYLDVSVEDLTLEILAKTHLEVKDEIIKRQNEHKNRLTWKKENDDPIFGEESSADDSPI